MLLIQTTLKEPRSSDHPQLAHWWWDILYWLSTQVVLMPVCSTARFTCWSKASCIITNCICIKSLVQKLTYSSWGEVLQCFVPHWQIPRSLFCHIRWQWNAPTLWNEGIQNQPLLMGCEQCFIRPCKWIPGFPCRFLCLAKEGRCSVTASEGMKCRQRTGLVPSKISTQCWCGNSCQYRKQSASG